MSAPRAPEELEALRELVASAVGFDEERGDIITIKSMALLSVPAIGTEAGTSLIERFDIDLMSILQMVVLAVVTLILGLFVVRPLLSRTPAPALDSSAPLALEAGATAQTPDLRPAAQEALSGELSGEGLDLPDFEVDTAFGDQLPDLPAMHGVDPQDPVDRLRNLIGERQEETVEILRSWLEDSEERA